jgi:photosystem II oxygen-evolving enhancer protein 3
MAQSLACAVSSGSLKLEGLAVQGAAKARVLNGRSSNGSVAVRRNVVVSASSMSNEEAETSSRRSVLSLLAASVAAGAFAQNANALIDIKLDGPPLPSGGLPGTENADEARDTDLDLPKRFFLQGLAPPAAAGRIKDAVNEIIAVKAYIDKKAWPYVQNDLRSKAQYLGFDLKTIIDSKSKPEKKELVALKAKVFDSINKLDYAARSKSTPQAEAAYTETVALLKKLVAQIA